MRIINGHVIDPAMGLDEIADIEIKNGRIAAVIKRQTSGRPVVQPDETGGEAKEPADGAGAAAATAASAVTAAAAADADADDKQTIDASGLIVAPGLIDVHVHFRDPGLTYKEDLLTGAAAAAAGGYTTVVCMANTSPAVDNGDTLSDILKRAQSAPIHILQCASVTEGLQGKKLVDMEGLKAAGAAGFTDDGVPIMNEEILLAAMKEAKRLGAVISVHEEDPLLIQQPGIDATAPHSAEDVMVARDCMLALYTGARVDIQHISSGVSVDLVRLAQRNGADVWAEATPHHFSLNSDAVARYGANAKMNPPLRRERDRLRVIEGLQDGTIGIIATDHAPHGAEEKQRELSKAPSGIIGLETALALGITHLVSPGYLSLSQLLEKMTANPAELYGLDCGTIKEGSAADLVIFDKKEAWTVDGFRSRSSNSPFIGHRLQGRVKYTLCGGHIVYGENTESLEIDGL